MLPGYGITPTPEVLARYHELNDYHWKQLELGNLTREQVMQYRFDRLLEELGCPVTAPGSRMRMKISWPQGKTSI